MADVVEVKVSGLREIEEALERAPLRVAKKIMRSGLLAPGRIWRNEIAARVRRGPHHGKKGSGVQFAVLATHVSMSTSVKNDLEGSVRVGFGPKLFWAKFLEFGTGPRVRRPKGISRSAWRERGGNRMPAFPFMRQAAEARKQDVLDKFTSSVRTALGDEYRS